MPKYGCLDMTTTSNILFILVIYVDQRQHTKVSSLFHSGGRAEGRGHSGGGRAVAWHWGDHLLLQHTRHFDHDLLIIWIRIAIKQHEPDLLAVKQLPFPIILASWPRPVDEQIVVVPIN